ncbi:MAG TPA: response regulator transcription factor [Trichormus sp.]|jgi:DNA-binding response OmpR family regulator
MAKILLVEDDLELAGTIQEWLSFENHKVEVANDGVAGWGFLQAYQYEVIILDWNVPGMTGLEICRHYRAKGGSSPILFLTGKSALEERELGLDTGADDYLVKPFHLKEMCARVRALLRRPAVMKGETIRIGQVTLESVSHRVTVNGQEIKLQPKEFSLLEFLMRHPNQVFGSRALLEAVWTADSEASELVVRTYVKNLRRKMSQDGDQGLIQTVHGLGYKVESK